MNHIKTISFKIVDGEHLNRLEMMRKRDSKIIYSFLGIIKNDFLKKKEIVNRSKLDLLTLTTTKRQSVKYNFKEKYPRISHDELQECRDAALANYKSFLELKKVQKNVVFAIDKPKDNRGIIPRVILFNGGSRGRFSLDLETNTISLRDSLDTNWKIINGNKTKVQHEKLKIPVVVSNYHLKVLDEYSIKSLIISKRNKQYYANISVACEVEKPEIGKEKAVMGIDMGINKTAFTVIMTETGIVERHTWHNKDKFKELSRLEEQYASVQREYHTRKKYQRGNTGRKLRELRKQRKTISLEYDRILIRELTDHILEQSERFDLKVGIGKLTGIRNRGRKGNGRGKKYRKMLHSWAFFRFTNLLTHNLSEFGLKHIVKPVNEGWTSIMCYRCNSKGIRPKQSYFKCLKCGVQNNADFNGAMNIAKRIVQKLKLIPDKYWGISGLGRYLPKVTPKTSLRRRSGKAVRTAVRVVAEQSENDTAMLKKYGKTVSSEQKEANLPVLGKDGYTDLSDIGDNRSHLAEHTRKVAKYTF